jgi:hypothetical protein
VSQQLIIRHPAIPIFRKVFRRNSVFVCGICRQEYDNLADANNCLNFCWFDLKNLDPVIYRRFLDHGKLYRCQYCGREHPSYEQAHACAEQCYTQRARLHIREQLDNDLPLSEERPRPIQLQKKPARTRDKLLQQVLKRQSSSSRLKTVALRQRRSPPKGTPPRDPSVTEPHVDLDELSLDATSTKADAVSPVAREAKVRTDESAQANAAPSHKPRHRDQFQAGWYRKDVHYVCRVCHKTHGGRLEAEICFDSHFNAEGWEKPRQQVTGPLELD